jgi:hypothetical protein
MPNLGDQSEKYISELLTDLNLEELRGQNREDMLEMLRSRFSEVIFNTTVRLLPEQQKAEYINAAMDPEANADKIVEITSQVPELAEGLEAAMLYEYEALKHSMQKK